MPPLAEQRRIVTEVERRLSVADELERAAEASMRRPERLRQAILKRAFEGKLVPQDPSDEPASALLDRIRAERERAAPQEKRAGAAPKRPRAEADGVARELPLFGESRALPGKA